ncbi:MAG: DUF3368 domain-containing protein [Desulfuromonadales bacterium]
MIVFSNTTPFIALSAIGRLDLMQSLFSSVYVVDDVVDECSHGGIIAVPDLKTLDWIKVVPTYPAAMASILLELDRGERNTISTAIDMRADRIIIDEKIGRNIADYLGLQVTGTLGILLKAKTSGLIPSFSEAARLMVERGIHYNPKLVERLVRVAGE